MTPNLRLWGREVAPVPGLAASDDDADADADANGVVVDADAAEAVDRDNEGRYPPAVRNRLKDGYTEDDAYTGPVGGGGSA